jgi:hypothetical protein
VEGDTLLVDSIMKDLGMYFDDQFWEIGSFKLLGMDSVNMSRFFHDDFFEYSFFNQDEQMLRMMRVMDSMKNDFFGSQKHSDMHMKR